MSNTTSKDELDDLIGEVATSRWEHDKFTSKSKGSVEHYDAIREEVESEFGKAITQKVNEARRIAVEDWCRELLNPSDEAEIKNKIRAKLEVNAKLNTTKEGNDEKNSHIR